MKILVIEDENTIREELVDWLTFEGFEALGAANGREGIEMALADVPDLIISDITMPEVDGYGVLLELQKHPRTMSIPFVFLTARADKSFVRHGMELGADDYLTKPFTLVELMSAINARLARHDAITTGIRQEVNDFKAKIMRMVSHELKTPLSSLIFVQQIIERQLGQLGERELTDLLQTMRVGTDRLEHLVQQIIYLTQIESGVLNPETIEETGDMVYLWQLMPLAVDQARRHAFRNRQGQIALDQRDAEVAVWGRTDLLKHALAELLSNALNFSSEDRPVAVTQWKSEGRVWISVLDQGIGMSRDEMRKATGTFQQVQRETREQQGLGMGLVVVQQLIELHGGTFEIGSVSGKGTQVTFSLPIYQEPA